MIDINLLLNNNTQNLSEDEKEYIEVFTDKLKDTIIDDLVEDEAMKMLKAAQIDREGFIDEVGRILTYGCKGFNKMPIQGLINIYLEKKSDVDFMNLLEKIQ